MAERRNYTVDEKYQWVMAILRNEASLVELARRHGVSRTSLENWRNQFLAGGREALENHPEQDSEKERLLQENEHLKAIVAEQSLELRLLKKNGR